MNWRLDHDFFKDRQILHPSRPAHGRLSRRPRRGRRLGRAVNLQVRLDRGPCQLELPGIKFFGGLAEVALEQCLQFCLGRVALKQGGAKLGAEVSLGCGMRLALGQEERMELGGIGQGDLDQSIQLLDR